MLGTTGVSDLAKEQPRVPDAKRLAQCCSIWDLREGSIVSQLETQGVVTSIEMQPDGSSFFTADGHAATLWDMHSKQVLVCWCAFVQAACMWHSNCMCRHHVSSGTKPSDCVLQGTRSFKLDYGVESASYCPAKGKFAAGGGNLWVYLHDAASGEELECNKGAGRDMLAIHAHVMHACMHTPILSDGAAPCAQNDVSPQGFSVDCVYRTPRACALHTLCPRWQLVCVWLRGWDYTDMGHQFHLKAGSRWSNA